MTTTLYRLYDADDQLLYVGITDNPTGRFTTHACEKAWWDHIATIRLEHYDSRREALALESVAIRDEMPLHNLAGSRRAEPVAGHRGWVLQRGTCSVCGRTQAISSYGRIWRHKVATYRTDGTIASYGMCSGSGRRQAVAV